MRAFLTVLALVVLSCIVPVDFAAQSQAPRPATLLLRAVEKDLRVLERSQLTGEDKKQRDRAKSVSQNARKLLLDERSDNDAEALSMAATAAKEVGALVRRELQLDRLFSAAGRYRAGDTIAAVQELAETLTSDLDGAVRYLEDNRDRLGLADTSLADANDKTLASLALVETEVAFRGRPDSGARLACVRRLLAVVDAGRLPERFVERWYVAVAGHLQGQMHLIDAVVHLDGALERFPNDPDVLVAAGAFYELMASPGVELPARDGNRVLSTVAMAPQNGPPRGGFTAPPDSSNDGYDRVVAAKKMGVSRAGEFYRAALALKADHAEAHVRLGRVLAMNGRTDDALAELRLAAASPDPRIHYLDSMFEGAVHESANRLDAAVACYQEAQRSCPKCLSAGLALSHAQRRRGDPTAAIETLNAAMQRDAETPFPDFWWDYPLGASWERDALMRDLRGGLR